MTWCTPSTHCDVTRSLNWPTIHMPAPPGALTRRAEVDERIVDTWAVIADVDNTRVSGGVVPHRQRHGRGAVGQRIAHEFAHDQGQLAARIVVEHVGVGGGNGLARERDS